MKGTRPMTPLERTHAHRERRKAEGWKMVTVYLEPQDAKALEALMKHTGKTQAEVIGKGLEYLYSQL